MNTMVLTAARKVLISQCPTNACTLNLSKVLGQVQLSKKLHNDYRSGRRGCSKCSQTLELVVHRKTSTLHASLLSATATNPLKIPLNLFVRCGLTSEWKRLAPSARGLVCQSRNSARVLNTDANVLHDRAYSNPSSSDKSMEAPVNYLQWYWILRIASSLSSGNLLGPYHIVLRNCQFSGSFKVIVPFSDQ